MTLDNIELFGEVIRLSPEKIQTNLIRKKIEKSTAEQRNAIHLNFFQIFSSLDDLYERSYDLAGDVLQKTTSQAMEIIAANEIYELTEGQFYDRYVGPYESWNEDFGPIAIQYEAIIERTAEFDAYRTARRQNRAKWVGFNKQAVYEADAKNLVSNVGHGVFNLMAKGITAIGNAMKKDEIFKDPATAFQVEKGLTNIIETVFAGLLNAISEYKPGSVYIYSPEDKSKTDALVENVEKGRIPKEKISSYLLKAIESYPYNRRAYLLLLQNLGGDSGRLDAAVDYFGIQSLDDEKEQIFKTKLKDTDLSSVVAIQSNMELLRDYANRIVYAGYEHDLNKILEAAKENDFQLEVAKYQLQTPSECDQNLPSLERYAQQIGYDHFAVWAAQVRKKVEDVHKLTEEAREKAQLLAERPKIVQLFLSKDPLWAKRRGIASCVMIALLISEHYAFNWLDHHDISEIFRLSSNVGQTTAKPAQLKLNALSDADVKKQMEASAFAEKLTSEPNSSNTRSDNPEYALDSNAQLESSEKSELNHVFEDDAATQVQVQENNIAPESQSGINLTKPPESTSQKLSAAAEKAIQEGFVEITDPSVQACTDAKIEAIRREIGEDSLINYEMYNEAAVECGFNI